MITSTKKDAIISIWAALVVLFLGVFAILLINFEGSYMFLAMAAMLIRLGHVSYPEPHPEPRRIVLFPNNRFLRWTFYSLFLFLMAHAIWQCWKILFSG